MEIEKNRNDAKIKKYKGNNIFSCFYKLCNIYTYSEVSLGFRVSKLTAYLKMHISN